jgi:hypothetical protein
VNESWPLEGPEMTKLLYLTAADKPALVAALAASGVKARIKVLRFGLRVCFDGAQAAVLSTINGLGFVNAAGVSFTAHSFNQPHEIFVHCRTA